MFRFSLINRPDGKLVLFSPEAKQSILTDKLQFEKLFTEISKNHPEIMPTETYQSIGLSFGKLSKSTWVRIISIARKLNCEIID